MRAIVWLFALALLADCRGPRVETLSEWRAGTREHEIRVGDTDRSFLLHVPAAARRNRFGAAVAYPIVLVLHGSGADGETVQMQSRMDPIADSLHFLVAYPNGVSNMLGLGSDWNAGKCCGNAARNNVDDLAFLRATVEAIARRLPVDRRRVYVAGFSDGGRMAYRVACDASTMVAAIAVVSGSVVDDSCVPARPVPLIAFHGTADREVSYTEPPEARTTLPLLATNGVPPSVRYWATANRCQRATTQRESPHVTRVQFAPCAADVTFYAVDGGEHAWPGGAKDGSDGAEPTRELDATSAMVTFFFRHPFR